MERELREFIELGEKKAGRQANLAKIISTRDTSIRLAKSGKRGLSDDICIKLADYIEEDRLEVIAASNLVTEKDEEKRKVFKSCFKNKDKAASIAMAAIVISVLTFAPTTTIQAASLTESALNKIFCIYH